MANRMIEWVDQRFPLTSFVKHDLTDYPTPRNLSYWWNFGFLAGFVLMVQIVSGIFLAMHYKADVNMAFDSIQHIMRDVNYGWLIRYLHSTGAAMFFVVIYIHMARTLYYGSYRAPRELLWWTGQVLLLMLMATAFMGYLLPWGQMSYWGAEVITNLFSTPPGVGNTLVVWLRGDFAIGDTTISRFFVLHYLFPFLICGMVMIHLIALHFVKSSNPSGIDLQAKDNIPFHPYFTLKDLYGLGLFLFVFLGFVFFAPEFFIESTNNVPANPLKTPSHIVPEWYFLPFYAILRAIPDAFGGVIAMGMSVLVFAAMPFLDRSAIPGGARYRPVYRVMFYLFLVDIVLLSYLGAKPPVGGLVVLGQVATAIYFGMFLLLPFISKAEERWLCRRGLPPELATLVEAEQHWKQERKSGSKRRNLFLFGIVFVSVLGAFSAMASTDRALADVDFDDSSESIQRGAELVLTVCVGCHSLKYLDFHDIAALDIPEAEYERLKGERKVSESIEAASSADMMRSIFGIVPPDLSIMTKAREGGPRYIYTLLMNYYEDADGLAGNHFLPGIKMPDIFNVAGVSDPAELERLQKDIRDTVSFLIWAADPHAQTRRTMGIYVLLYVAVLTLLLYWLKKDVWARLPKA